MRLLPPKSRSSERGSTPLELVTLVTLLLLPLAPGVVLYEQLSNELAAESIARHGLRLAILEAPKTPQHALENALMTFSESWGKAITSHRYWCSQNCSMANLEVQIGGATAIQTMGLTP